MGHEGLFVHVTVLDCPNQDESDIDTLPGIPHKLSS